MERGRQGERERERERVCVRERARARWKLLSPSSVLTLMPRFRSPVFGSFGFRDLIWI